MTPPAGACLYDKPSCGGLLAFAYRRRIGVAPPIVVLIEADLDRISTEVPGLRAEPEQRRRNQR